MWAASISAAAASMSAASAVLNAFSAWAIFFAQSSLAIPGAMLAMTSPCPSKTFQAGAASSFLSDGAKVKIPVSLIVRLSTTDHTEAKGNSAVMRKLIGVAAVYPK